MRKIVLISNRPWSLKDFLCQICKETECEIETIIIGKYYFGKEQVLSDDMLYDFYNITDHERLQKEFPNTEVKAFDDEEKMFNQAKTYINKEDILILADVEYKEDWIFQLLNNSINEFGILNNVIIFARYMDSMDLCNRNFKNILISSPEYQDAAGNLGYDENDEDYLRIKMKLTR